MSAFDPFRTSGQQLIDRPMTSGFWVGSVLVGALNDFVFLARRRRARRLRSRPGAALFGSVLSMED